jgi:hypothetical protein
MLFECEKGQSQSVKQKSYFSELICIGKTTIFPENPETSIKWQKIVPNSISHWLKTLHLIFLAHLHTQNINILFLEKHLDTYSNRYKKERLYRGGNFPINRFPANIFWGGGCW